MFKILKNNKGFLQFLANPAFWSAAAPIVGSVAGGLLGQSSAKSTNKAQAREADINRNWQEEMSNTAHQREVEDLRAAGLNPILSAKYGGSSTPSGSMATLTNPGHDLSQSVSHGVSSALVAQQNRANIALTQAQQQKTEAETKYILEGMGETNKQPWYMRDLKKAYSIGSEINSANQARKTLDQQEENKRILRERKKRKITVNSW